MEDPTCRINTLHQSTLTQGGVQSADIGQVNNVLQNKTKKTNNIKYNLGNSCDKTPVAYLAATGEQTEIAARQQNFASNERS